MRCETEQWQLTRSSCRRASRPRAPIAAQVAFFTLSSVESFERHMEDTQQTMGVDPKRYVPINYVSETPIASVLANFAPTLLFIGALLYMSQRAAGQVRARRRLSSRREAPLSSNADVPCLVDARGEARLAARRRWGRWHFRRGPLDGQAHHARDGHGQVRRRGRHGRGQTGDYGVCQLSQKPQGGAAYAGRAHFVCGPAPHLARLGRQHPAFLMLRRCTRT